MIILTFIEFYPRWALVATISTVAISATVSAKTSWRTRRQVNGVRRDPRDHPAASRIGTSRRTTPRTKAGQLGSHRSRSSVLLVHGALIRERGRAGRRDTSPAGGSSSMWKETARQATYVQREGRFVAAVPSVHPSAARSSADVIATSSDAAVVCIPELCVSLRCSIIIIVTIAKIIPLSPSHIQTHQGWQIWKSSTSCDGKLKNFNVNGKYWRHFLSIM